MRFNARSSNVAANMPLEGYDIVCFTYADWFASWSTPQQIMSRLAPANRVLYVDHPRSFLYWTKGADPQGAGKWDGPRVREVQSNLHVLHMPHRFLPVGKLPFPMAKRHLQMNGRLIARIVQQEASKLGMSKPILWNFSPLHGGAVQQVPARLRVYDIADEWTNYIRHDAGRQVVNWIDEQLCRSADLVFPSTENQHKRREHLNQHMHVVPHGADFAHFSKGAEESTLVADEVRKLPKPVIGSIGVLDPHRFDVGLFEHLSAARPDWSMVLVGPARADMDTSRLADLPNVYLTGNRTIEQLPNYLKGFDVCLIPYLVNEATRDIYPLKLQEYLAAGKPVVSSAMPSVMAYDGAVQIAKDHAGFVVQIERALADTSAEARAKRQQVARENSWEHRVEEKSRWVLERLAALGAA